jgi:hypothetical protein
VTCGPTWDPGDDESTSKNPSRKPGPGRGA